MITPPPLRFLSKSIWFGIPFNEQLNDFTDTLEFKDHWPHGLRELAVRGLIYTTIYKLQINPPPPPPPRSGENFRT